MLDDLNVKRPPAVLQQRKKDQVQLPKESLYDTWRKNPTAETSGALLRSLKPAIQKGVSVYVGPQASAVDRGRAKQLALAAIKTYDPAKGTHLNTHIIQHLQGLRRIKHNQQIIQEPERRSKLRRDLYKVRQSLEDTLGYTPTDEQVADHLRISRKKLDDAERYARPVAESTLSNPSSGEDSSYVPQVARDTSSLYWDVIYNDHLNKQSQAVMDMTQGTHGKPKLSAVEIAQRLGISLGRVSQIRKQLQQQKEELEGYGIFS